MKINFDWNNFSTDNSQKRSDRAEQGRGQEGILFSSSDKTFLNIAGKIKEDFAYGDQGVLADGMLQSVDADKLISMNRNKMAVMAGSMSAEDFQKMKEDGYQITSMEPDEIVTIMDKIKTELAKSGTHISGYTDTLSAEKMAIITGSSGYARQIAAELARADAPVTKENIMMIDEAVDQALTLTQPGDGNKAYLITKGMEPTISNFYKAGHSSINYSSAMKMAGYTSSEYSRYGMNTGSTRKTVVSSLDLHKIEKQIKGRIQESGMEVNNKTVENGKWLVEKGIPVNAENLRLLEKIESVSFPIDISKVIKQGAIAISEGESPLEIDLSEERDSIYYRAADLFERYHALDPKAADYAVERGGAVSLVAMEEYNISITITRENVHARRTLEEVRLRMTVEANVKLLRSGYAIDTAPMEDLIEELKKAASQLEESLFGVSGSDKKAEVFKNTIAGVNELPTLPLATVGRVPFMKEAIFSEVLVQGRIIQQQYVAAGQSYETMATAPRYDLGDSIKKAFRNVDNILTDMGLEISEANQRAIRIMGYNQISITHENLDKIKEADHKVRTIMDKMKPGITLQMIREGMNPLEMSLDEIQDYIVQREEEFSQSSEKYSEFLYKLEKKDGITKEERDAYIGIYRMMRQIEKTDGAALGSLIAGEAGINFSNLLSAVRSRKVRGTDIRIDDSFGGLEKVIRRGVSITDQIKAMDELSNDRNMEKQLSQEQLAEMQELIKSSSKEKEYLEIYKQPVTLDHLQGVQGLLKKRGQAFKKLVDLENTSPESALNAEESILEDAMQFLASMEEKEERSKNYDKVIEKSKTLLEESIDKRDITYLDVKELQSVYKQISVSHNLSREENYEVPMQLGNEITSINLKVVHSSVEYGNVKITMSTAVLGKVEARFVMTENILEGSILTDYMDGKKILEGNAASLSESIKEALEETKIELRNIFFGVNKNLDINVPEKGEKTSEKNIDLLYKVAKSFIYYVKEVSDEQIQVEGI